jgi:hypothetical protein
VPTPIIIIIIIIINNNIYKERKLIRERKEEIGYVQ